MKLRTDAIGHFDIPTELNIHDAVTNSKENDLVKLMSDEVHFLSVWIGQQSVGHRLILKSGPWKQECTEKLSSKIVINLMIEYLHDDLSSLKEHQWARPFDQIFLDNIMKLKNNVQTRIDLKE